MLKKVFLKIAQQNYKNVYFILNYYFLSVADTDYLHHGTSGFGSKSTPSSSPLPLPANIRLVVNAIAADPTINPATAHPIATAKPDFDFVRS